jgi:hypothetical protein
MHRSFLLLLVFSVVLSTSCSIQKRLHRPGYSISSSITFPNFQKKSTETSSGDKEVVAQEHPIIASTYGHLAFSVDNKVLQERAVLKKEEPSDTIKVLPCDEIILINGDTIKGERLIQMNQKVYYTPCGSKDTKRPFVMEKQVRELRYKDGKTTVLKYGYYPVAQSSTKKDNFNQQKSTLAIVSIVIASIGFPGLILFGYGGILGLIGLLFGIAAGAKRGGIVQPLTRRLVLWGIVLSGLVLFLGLLILSMWL